VEDAPAGQLVRQQSAAGTEPADTDVSEAGPAPEGDPPVSDQRTGGRRYRAGRPPAQPRQPSEQPRVHETAFTAGIGAWGTLAGLFACCLASCLLAAWLHLIVLAGLGFCAGCAVATWYCQPAALLRMVIAVPSVFFVAEVNTADPGGSCAVAIRGHRGCDSDRPVQGPAAMRQ
jgi:hypothetical protein